MKRVVNKLKRLVPRGNRNNFCFSIAEGARLELADPCGPPVFKTGAVAAVPTLHTGFEQFYNSFAQVVQEHHRGFEPLLSVWRTDVLAANTNDA